MVTILIALAEFERNVTSDRVKQNAKVRLISDGKINGATEVLGLDKCSERKGHYVINSAEVAILKRFEEYITDNLQLKNLVN